MPMPIMYQVPVPIIQQESRDCIIRAGKRFCEDIDISMREGGIMGLVMILWIGGAMLVCFEAEDRWDNGFLALIAYLAATFGLMIVFGG